MTRATPRRLLRLIGLCAHLLAGAVLAFGLFPLLDVVSTAPVRARQRIVRAWMRGLCRLFGVRVEIEGAPAPGPVLFAANHISWLDIPVLYAAADAAFVAKAEVRAWPLVGGMAARAGTLFLRRGEGRATNLVADEMTFRLAQGRNLAVFPEATTSDGQQVRPFHARLFQAAIRAHATVQPVALRYLPAHGADRLAPFVGDATLLAHVWRLLRAPAIPVRVVFGPPLAATGHARRPLAQAAHAAVEAALFSAGVSGTRERI